MLFVYVTPRAKRELEKLKKRTRKRYDCADRSIYLPQDVTHTPDHEFWQRISDYTEISPTWLYRNGIRHTFPHGRHGGALPPLSIPQLNTKLIDTTENDGLYSRIFKDVDIFSVFALEEWVWDL